jgi:hypothetical protein
MCRSDPNVFAKDFTMTPVIIASSAPDRLKPFVAALETTAGVSVKAAGTAEAALACAKTESPVLMVFDEDIDQPVFSLVKDIMSVNALINTAVISDQPEDEFHETSEGLGILMQLPRTPAAKDAAALWDKLVSIGAVSLPAS